MSQTLADRMVQFFGQHQLIKYQAKEFVYHPDEVLDRVGFVKTGFVRIFSYDLAGKEITYSGFKPIFYLSYYFAKNKVVNPYYFQALTALEVWKAPLHEFEEYLIENPTISVEVLNSSLVVIQNILGSWENTLTGNAYKRVGRLLVALAQNSGKSVDSHIVIDFYTTHSLIASMLGISRETASIQIKLLEKNKFIYQGPSAITIVDIDSMAKFFSATSTKQSV